MPKVSIQRLTDADAITVACAKIKIHHRGRRFAMKTRQKLNLSLQSYIRVNYTDWEYDAPEAEKTKSKAEVAAILKDARLESPQTSAGIALAQKVRKIDHSCEIWDEEQTAEEKEMERIVRSLPIAPWVKSIKGAGEKGVATIIGEAGNLSNYPTIEKLWKRLGFAPYDGHAGSTWRLKMGPRTLTADEWVANPFVKERYSFMQQNALALWKSQWIGKEADPEHKGQPKGHYGEIFARRKAHTLQVHPEWYLDKDGKPKVDKEYGNPTSAHAQADALRVMYKAFLHDLWREWRASSRVTEKSNYELPATTILSPPVPDRACVQRHIVPALADSVPV